MSVKQDPRSAALGPLIGSSSMALLHDLGITATDPEPRPVTWCEV